MLLIRAETFYSRGKDLYLLIIIKLRWKSSGNMKTIALWGSRLGDIEQ